jgi:sulfite exporter TauE/SafE
MGLGTSFFLIALGAVLRFAVHVSTSGFNLHTIGVILMIIGVIGLIISLLWMTVWSRRRDRVLVDDRPVAARPPDYADPYYR